MALTDPELDLLRELLDDDPTDGVFVQVGEELVRRAQWQAAYDCLRLGLDANADDEDAAPAWPLLARASLEIGDLAGALAACAHVGVDPAEDAELARVQLLALERTGRFDDARAAAVALLAAQPDDVVVEALLERLDAPDPEPDKGLPDPLLTVGRAEAYVAMGRADRAVRLYRRLVFHFPGDTALEGRLRKLTVQPHEFPDDDLSEELGDPEVAPAEFAAPPELTMPSPMQQLRAMQTVPPPPERAAGPARDAAEAAPFAAGLPVSFDDIVHHDDEPTNPRMDLQALIASDPSLESVWDDGPTDTHGGPGGANGKRRRRSLIRK